MTRREQVRLGCAGLAVQTEMTDGQSMSKVSGNDTKNTLYCSFCGKSQHEVRKLIAGPTVFICDECVELCMDIIREENKNSFVKSRDGVPTPGRDLLGARRLCDRPGPRQEGALGRRSQSLQAHQPRQQEQRRRARQVQHPAGRPDRLRQDAAGPDAGPHPRCAVHDGRRHDADRSRLCRRGRREHHPEAAADRPTTTSSAPSAASSISTRSTRSAASPTTPPSPATCRARACSRPC